MSSYIRHIILAIVLVLFQVLVLNNIQFSGYANPFVYLLIVLILPVNIPRYLLLIIGFVLGLSIDIFTNTPGIHASATVFIVWLRPLIINVISQRDQFDEELTPGIPKFGFWWFLKYVTLVVIIHHTFLFFVEAFTFVNMLQTMMRILLSSAFSIIVIVLSQMIIFRNK